MGVKWLNNHHSIVCPTFFYGFTLFIGAGLLMVSIIAPENNAYKIKAIIFVSQPGKQNRKFYPFEFIWPQMKLQE
jgi:hypothetical protein